MTAIVSTQRSRKLRRCTDQAAPFCSRWIEKGEAYTRTALPPHSGPVYADSWWIIHSCLDCEVWRGGALVFDYSRMPGEVMP